MEQYRFVPIFDFVPQERHPPTMVRFGMILLCLVVVFIRNIQRRLFSIGLGRLWIDTACDAKAEAISETRPIFNV